MHGGDATKCSTRGDTSGDRLHTHCAESSRDNRTGQPMRFNSAVFRIDPTPQTVGGGYVAHAKISCRRDDGAQQDIHVSGGLAGFDLREDAVSFATHWAMEWLERRYG
jgi:hypothetical protein